MATWELSTEYKKNAIERQYWYKDGKVAIREEGYRWGTFTTDSDEKPNIDLHNEDGYELDSGEYDWELYSLDDGCWADWDWPDDMDEEEVERLEAIWEDNYFEGLEEEGWSQDDTEYEFHGPLRLVNKDTGEVFSILDEDGNIIPKPKGFTEEDFTDWYPMNTDPVRDGEYETSSEGTTAWPFPSIKKLDWAQGKWWDSDCKEVDKLTLSKWRGLKADPNTTI
jgi:hypothetical protein